MAQDIGPSSSWSLENHVANIYWTSKGNTCSVRSMQGVHPGMYVKSTFHEKENHAFVILERIHTDVCGPFSVASTTKHRYYVIFVDEFSRK
jgi:hypothetical protein